ncbi:MAG: SpoIID/LytB domain-containing protein [Faecalibacterium sp.]
MKKAFLLLCAALLALGCVLPSAGYALARAALGKAEEVPAVGSDAEGQAEPGGLGGLAPQQNADAPADADAEVFRVEDSGTGQLTEVPRREYLIGAVAAEMPITWPDEALKAQAIAAHSYVLYCRDHCADPSGAWLTADPARRQGYLTDAVLRSYWGTAYEANYARLSALVDEVLTKVLYYDGAPAGTSYFAISNGRTEASENVWGAALPYLTAVDSSADSSAENYEYTVVYSVEQVRQLLTDGLGLTPDVSAPERWFGAPEMTPSGYVARLPVCGQSVAGTTLRRVLGLRSACFAISYQADGFHIVTRGYGHGVGLSQWGAKALAEQGQSFAQILAHYFPGTELRG